VVRSRPPTSSPNPTEHALRLWPIALVAKHPSVVAHDKKLQRLSDHFSTAPTSRRDAQVTDSILEAKQKSFFIDWKSYTITVDRDRGQSEKVSWAFTSSGLAATTRRDPVFDTSERKHFKLHATIQPTLLRPTTFATSKLCLLSTLSASPFAGSSQSCRRAGSAGPGAEELVSGHHLTRI
jgi:hypothetical protein